jgi:hypothetical protein
MGILLSTGRKMEFSVKNVFNLNQMDIQTRAAIKIQSVWRMWFQKREYDYMLYEYHMYQQYEDYTDEQLRDMELDACEAEFEYKYHMYHCGGY